MKIIKITYHCDYCQSVINPDTEPVCFMQTGIIGPEESLEPKSQIKHYHDKCLTYLMSLTSEKQETEQQAEPDQKDKAVVTTKETTKKRLYNQYHDPYKGPIKKGERDLGAVNALFQAGWTSKEIAKEAGVAIKTVYQWKYAITSMKREGTWEQYLEERSKNYENNT